MKKNKLLLPALLVPSFVTGTIALVGCGCSASISVNLDTWHGGEGLQSLSTANTISIDKKNNYTANIDVSNYQGLEEGLLGGWGFTIADSYESPTATDQINSAKVYVDGNQLSQNTQVTEPEALGPNEYAIFNDEGLICLFCGKETITKNSKIKIDFTAEPVVDYFLVFCIMQENY